MHKLFTGTYIYDAFSGLIRSLLARLAAMPLYKQVTPTPKAIVTFSS